MKLGLKIILVVLPLIVASILIAGMSSAFSAQTGITRIAIESLGFKAQEFKKYAENQWQLLVNNDLAEDDDYLKVTKRAVQSYAASLVRSESELIFAVDRTGDVVMSTAEVMLSNPAEREVLKAIASERREGWQEELTIAGQTRVGQSFVFAPFEWTVLVTDTWTNFYSEVENIRVQTYAIVGAAALLAILLLAIFARVLTAPLTRLIDLVQEITQTNDLSQRAEIEYKDEIGAMAKRFNGMLSELQNAQSNLQSAYDKVKEQAERAEIAQWKEFRIRKVFERYVPAHVIDSVQRSPERAFEPENRVLAVLFSDIRSFTTISEGLPPDVVIESLNRYFSLLVPIIKKHNGLVDKYIGDAIMAFFGAPTSHENDALDALLAALEMQQALPEFNAEQVKRGLPEFRTGIGVERGAVVVGNMGCEDKMDYTIIGNKVNSGSRLEGLTKEYKQEVIFSKAVFMKAKDELPCRFVEKVMVKGQQIPQEVYTAKLAITDRERKAWGYYHKGIVRYHQKQLSEALKYFIAADKFAPDDPLTHRWIERTRGGYKPHHVMDSK